MSNTELAETVGLLVPVLYFVMLGVESRWPARDFPPRRGWRWLGIGFLLLIAAVGTVVPLLVSPDWLAAHRWLDATSLGVAGGTLAGWLVLSFISFLYHRLSHFWSPLWRLSHQLHHSPQRVDISGSVLFHPLEMVVQVLWALFATTIVLGLDPLAAALVGVVQAFHGMFQHWNVHTPAWLGISCNAPKRIACTTGAACTPTTIPTFRFGTCLPAVGATRATSKANAASMRLSIGGSEPCWRGSMSTAAATAVAAEGFAARPARATRRLESGIET